MNRFIIRILLAIVVTAAAGACINEHRDRHDPVVRLAFEPIMYMQVRTSMNTEDMGDVGEVENSDETSFGVSVWQLPEGMAWNNSRQSAHQFLDAVRLVSDGEHWSPESGDNWPSIHYTITCIGFSPYEAADGCDITNGVRFEGIDTSTDPGNLCYTQPQTNLIKSQNGGVVTLPLQQALCMVDFRIRDLAEDETTKLYVRSITLDNIAIRGDFRSLPDPTWTIHGDNTPLTIFEGDMQLEYAPQHVGSIRRLIPQEINSTVTVEYEIVSASGPRIRHFDTTLPIARKLEAGRHYTFTLAFSSAGLEVLP